VKWSQRVKRQVLINGELIAGSSCGRPATPEVTVVRHVQSQGLQLRCRGAHLRPQPCCLRLRILVTAVISIHDV
jgi:hypothetical protein